MRTEVFERNGLIWGQGPGGEYNYPITTYKSGHFVGIQTVTVKPNVPNKNVENPLFFVGYKATPHFYVLNTTGYTAANNVGWYFASESGLALMDDGYATPGSRLGGVTDESVIWPQLSDQAMEKVYDQLRGQSNLAVDYAERHETKRMLKGMTNARDGIVNLLGFAGKMANSRRGRRDRRTRGQVILDIATSSWMGYRYGIMPAMYSVYDALETLQKQLTRVKGNPIPLIGAAGTQQRQEGVWIGPSGNRYKVIEVASFTVRHKVQFTSAAFDNSVYDWTSLNPATIAWEAAPLSWVGDWFWNVGQTISLWENYLNHISMTNQVVTTNRYRRDVVVQNATSSYNNVPPDENGNYPDHIRAQSRYSGYTRRDYCKQRTASYDLPVPSGVRFRANLNAKRLLDASSLIHQLTRVRKA